MELKLDLSKVEVEVGDIIIANNSEDIRMIVKIDGEYQSINLEGRSTSLKHRTLDSLLALYDIDRVIKNKDLIITVK